MVLDMIEGPIPAGRGRVSNPAAPSLSRRISWLTLAAVLVALAAVMLAVANSAGAQTDEIPEYFDNQYCLGCHGAPGLTKELPSGEILDLQVAPEIFDTSIHGQNSMPCALCHTNITGFPHEDPFEVETGREFTYAANQVCANCHYEQFTQTADNVHHAALEGGNLEAATCSDCHGAHDTSAPGHRSTEIPATCRTCHFEIYELYSESVHGQALIDGNEDVPTCTDCHGVHDVDGPGEDSPFHLFSPQVCADCHADEDLMDQYGISTNVFESYVADFHGSTVVLFEELAPDQETNKPVCIDCHGVHAIKPADDPTSTVFRENLLQTCQRCHPDAEANFPTSWMSHYSPEPGQATLVWLVTMFYKIIIPVVVGGMALLVLIDAARRNRARRREASSGTA